MRRSLSIAEQIGETGTVAVDFGNLGILSTRFGELREAEEYYKRGLTLAEQIHDPVYTSLFYSYLATAMQDQGKIDEARKSLCQALRIGRAMSITLGVALIALGQLHIAQALASQEDNRSLAGTTRQQGNTTYTDFLRCARTTLRRALALEGLEAETRTEGQLTLAQVSFLLGEFGTAQQQADLHFQKAMEVPQKCGMRLEYARTLQKYGLALLQRSLQRR